MTFLVEKTIVCFQFKGFFNRKVLFFPGIERNSQEVRFFFCPNLSLSSRMGRIFRHFPPDPGSNHRAHSPLQGNSLGISRTSQLLALPMVSRRQASTTWI